MQILNVSAVNAVNLHKNQCIHRHDGSQAYVFNVDWYDQETVFKDTEYKDKEYK